MKLAWTLELARQAEKVRNKKRGKYVDVWFADEQAAVKQEKKLEHLTKKEKAVIFSTS